MLEDQRGVLAQRLREWQKREMWEQVADNILNCSRVYLRIRLFFPHNFLRFIHFFIDPPPQPHDHPPAPLPNRSWTDIKVKVGKPLLNFKQNMSFVHQKEEKSLADLKRHKRWRVLVWAAALLGDYKRLRVSFQTQDWHVSRPPRGIHARPSVFLDTEVVLNKVGQKKTKNPIIHFNQTYFWCNVTWDDGG